MSSYNKTSHDYNFQERRTTFKLLRTFFVARVSRSSLASHLLSFARKTRANKACTLPVNLEALNFILFIQCKGLKESRREPIDMSNIPPVDRQHAAATPPLLDEDPDDEEESFSTQQLFKFAWQIAKGMVGIIPLD